MTWDVVVAGLGVMGSATAYELARRGLRVLGVEQFGAGHDRGSSHGDSRIIREMIFEHPLYVPIVQRSYELWAELADDTGTEVLGLPGCLLVGPPAGRVVQGAREAAGRHQLPFEELGAAEIAHRWPGFHPSEDYVGVWDPRGGYVRADVALRTLQDAAARHGACLVFESAMRSWRREGDGVAIEIGTTTHRAGSLVLCLGPWIGAAVPELGLPVSVERQVLVWFDPPPMFDRATRGSVPVYIAEHRPGHTSYGFPRLERGVKAAVFHEGAEYRDPSRVDRQVSAADVAAVRAALAPLIPSFATAPVRTNTTCLFTNTPDGRFVIDWHPDHQQVLICSACSGHGFKFSAAVGEINADLIATRRSRFDLTPFSISRFVATP